MNNTVNPTKGKFLGECARKCCTFKSAVYFNESTREYYCYSCARKINHANNMELCVMQAKTKPYFHDCCHHEPGTYQGSFTASDGNYDVYVFRELGCKEDRVCLRYGDEGPEYLSAGPVERLLKDTPPIESYQKAAEIIKRYINPWRYEVFIRDVGVVDPWRCGGTNNGSQAFGFAAEFATGALSDRETMDVKVIDTLQKQVTFFKIDGHLVVDPARGWVDVDKLNHFDYFTTHATRG